MYIDLSHVFDITEPNNLSASVSELGPSAGAITWAHALAAAERLLGNDLRMTEERIHELCGATADWALDTGAWSEDEVDAWDDPDCIALLLQNISADMREAGVDTILTAELGIAKGDSYTYAARAADELNETACEGSRGSFYYYVSETGTLCVEIRRS